MAQFTHDMRHRQMHQKQQSQSTAIASEIDPVIQYTWGGVAFVTFSFWSSIIYLFSI